MKTIAIDATILGKEIRGVGTYVLNFIKHLQLVDKKHEYIIILPFASKYFSIVQSSNFRTLFVNRLQLPFLKECVIAKKLLQSVNLLHSPANVPNPFLLKKTVLTLHDTMMFMSVSRVARLKAKLHDEYRKRMISMFVKKVPILITVSECSKKDINKFLGVPEEKIFVINLAPDPSFSEIKEAFDKCELKDRFNIARRFILAFAAEDTRKNTIRLVQSFSLVKQKGVKDYQLVLVGNCGTNERLLHKIISYSGISNDVIQLKKLTLTDLVKLYRSSDLLVYPSIYEGFGLPVLEAMQCGVPVVASQNPSISEIAKDIALLINPYNIGDIAEGMKTVLLDSRLRDEMIKEGFKKVQMYSWQKNVLQTLQVYRILLKE